MVYTFDDAKAPSRHTTQYFEMFGNRAIYTTAGWPPPRRRIRPVGRWAQGVDVNDYKWELYNVEKDFSEANNLAAKEPQKLKELQDLFWQEAEKYNVLPIDNSKVERFDVSLRPSLTRGRDEFTYYPGMVRIPEGTAPDTKNKSCQIKAEVEIPAGGAEGMLLTHGGRFAGRALPAQGQAGLLLQPRRRRPLLRRRQGRRSRPARTPSFSTSSTTAAASAKAASARFRWTARKLPNKDSREAFRSASRRTRPWMSAVDPKVKTIFQPQ